MATLAERQRSIREKLEKEFKVGLEEEKTKEGGTKKMKKQSGVKTKMATKVVPPVDLETVEDQAVKYLEELKEVANFDGIKYELEKVHTGLLNFRRDKKLIFGIRYSVCRDKVTYSLVAKEGFKNFSKSLKGHYSPGNWDILFDLTNSDDIKKFTPIIEESLAKYRKAEQPKAKAKK